MIKLCLWCTNKFDAKCNKNFCSKCIKIQGKDISRTFKIKSIIYPTSKCNNCFINFTIDARNKLFCIKCRSITNIHIIVWQRKNRDKTRIAQQKYRKNNLELCRERVRKNQIILNDKNRFGGFRIVALKRDNYICQKCNKDVSEKNMAVIHHLNHDKTDNRLANFQTLCKSCHTKHHYKNRGYQFTSKQIKKIWKEKGKAGFNR